jgi:hypothetical protein
MGNVQSTAQAIQQAKSSKAVSIIRTDVIIDSDWITDSVQTLESITLNKVTFKICNICA